MESSHIATVLALTVVSLVVATQVEAAPASRSATPGASKPSSDTASKRTRTRRSARAGAATPCFVGAPLLASTVFVHLDSYGTGMHVYDGTKPLPTTEYGSCKVRKGALWTANNELVAHINCGLSVVSRGVVNHLGLGVGASGKHIIRREFNPGKGLICVNQGSKSLCWFMPVQGDDEPWVKYTVKARLPGQSLRGSKALAFFAKQTVAAYHVTMYCH